MDPALEHFDNPLTRVWTHAIKKCVAMPNTQQDVQAPIRGRLDVPAAQRGFFTRFGKVVYCSAFLSAESGIRAWL